MPGAKGILPLWYTDCFAFHAFAILKHLKSARFSTKNGCFSVFCGSISHAFHASMKRMTFWPLYLHKSWHTHPADSNGVKLVTLQTTGIQDLSAKQQGCLETVTVRHQDSRNKISLKYDFCTLLVGINSCHLRIVTQLKQPTKKYA